MKKDSSFRDIWLLPAAVLLIGAAATLTYLLGLTTLSHYLLMAGLAVCAAPLLWRTLQQALHSNFATDAVASLSIITALVLSQPIPGLIIVLMQSGGEALERIAQRRATAALSELERRAPRNAHRRSGAGYEDVPVENVAVGDEVLVRPGEVVPVDGIVREGRSHVNTAAITGEPMPVSALPGVRLYSGFLNEESPLHMEVTALAGQSQYARIVELVRTAQATKAPLQRLADRYAVWFTPFTLVVAAIAFAVSGSALRILAVLVVATPCPLILATPVALIGGVNRAARARIIVRSGAALENLAQLRAAVFDKTGTLTTGKPAPETMTVFNGWNEATLLPLVAAVEQGSSHVLARSLVTYAQERGATPAMALNVQETPGRGVFGTVDGKSLVIGSERFVNENLKQQTQQLPGSTLERLRSYVAVNGELAAIVEFDDKLRADLQPLFSSLRATGIERIVIVSGNDDATVQGVARQLKVDEAFGELHPADKVEHVRRLMRDVGPTLMIGDGTNDAPALAAATVGLAVTGGSGDIAAETADAILLGDNLQSIGETIQIAQRALRIAKQSILVGLGLSGMGMVAAAIGWLPPIGGALFQEAVDVAVILNALRAARGPVGSRTSEG